MDGRPASVAVERSRRYIRLACLLPSRSAPASISATTSTRRAGTSIVPRPDDIVITTSLKAGTTWTQRIVSLLVFQTTELPTTLHWVSPWPDCRFIGGKAEMQAIVESLEHRRFLKSHLAFDALPYRESTKYIYVGRDTRDVFMSTWNHVAPTRRWRARC